MKKDIHISKVENLHLAIIQEYNKTFKVNDYYAYLINEKKVDLEIILIVSKGFDETKETSKMHHKIEKLPAKSIAKIELIQEDIFQLNNEFKVTFFENNKMFEKNFLIKKNTIKEGNLRILKTWNKKGILIK
ncbi:MAG: hypothetical protein KAT78_04605 [Flavobacteriaceae bacterium]|nr:hypothetical protein [Flavobacteriaceae bacterium]